MVEPGSGLASVARSQNRPMVFVDERHRVGALLCNGGKEVPAGMDSTNCHQQPHIQVKTVKSKPAVSGWLAAPG